jgi:hypothetical protein
MAHGVVSSVDEAVKTGHEAMNSLLVAMTMTREAVTTAREAEGSVDEPVRTGHEATNSVLGAVTTGRGVEGSVGEVVSRGPAPHDARGLPSFASVPGDAPRSALFSRP